MGFSFSFQKPFLKRFLAALSFGILALVANAQDLQYVWADPDTENSAGFRTAASVTYSPAQKWELFFEEEINLRDNYTKFDYSLTTLQFTYKPVKYFSCGAAYALHVSYRDANAAHNYQNWWEARNRLLIHYTGTVYAGNFSFALRNHWRVTFRGAQVDPNAAPDPIWEVRTRLKINYNTPGKPIKPYVLAEMYNPLNYGELQQKRWINLIQYKLGFVWNIDKHNSLDIYYLLMQNLSNSTSINYDTGIATVSPDRSLQHVFAVVYYYKF